MNQDLIYNPKDYHANDGQHDYHVWTFVDYHSSVFQHHIWRFKDYYYDPETDWEHIEHMKTVDFRDEYSGWNDE